VHFTKFCKLGPLAYLCAGKTIYTALQKNQADCARDVTSSREWPQ